MSRSDKPAWLHFLLVAVPSGVLSCVVTIWVVSPSPVSEPHLTSSEGNSDRILQELRELRARLDDGFRTQSMRVSEASAQERQPLPPTNPQVDRFANLIERLNRLLRMGQLPIGAVSLATQRDAPINWSELSALIELHRQDVDAARRSVQMLTVKEVVARFGFPSEVGASDAGFYWSYQRKDGKGEPNGYVLFTFTDGYVIYPDIHMPNR